MNIAIVHDFLTKIGGAERVLSVVHTLYPDAPIFTLLYDHDGVASLFGDSKPTIIPSSLNRLPRAIRGQKKFLFNRYQTAIEEFDFSEYDVVISFSNSFAHGVITKPKTKHICYCYSPARFLWDWHSEYLIENRIGYDVPGLYIRQQLSNIRIWDRLSAHRVDHWLTQSKTVQQRIQKYYRANAQVIYPPANIETIKPATGEPNDYFLIVSRLEPYKQIDRAIEAFNQTGRTLVIIGTGSDEKRLKSIANNTIEFLGWQSDSAVYEYLRNCTALVFPGEEDYGLTPIEAMAAGRPVVALNRGGVTETVIEGKTGTFFHNNTPEEINVSIDRLLMKYDNYSINTCRTQAEYFSTTRFLSLFGDTINALIHHE